MTASVGVGKHPARCSAPVRRAAAAALLALSLAAPLPSRAQSGRWGSVDVSAGTYRPDIDSEFTASSRPVAYEPLFGTRRGWMFRLGLARKLFDRFGSLEAGLRTGFFQAHGKGLQDLGGGTFAPSGDPTNFRIIPTSVALTYRFDWAAERYPIPLAPYGRIAFERYNWWITDGAGHTSMRGATNGWSAAAGLAVLLDIFDRQAARELDAETGINHTYAFAEIGKSWVDDFGSSTSWDLTDPRLSFAFGLLFVF